ncbi:hypothetical protein ON058_00910 [Demequina sp. B12]|uniref:hypothetical protein n=1 Tax=Demequina sp. B12 TaxID=2992757 RepID=UPI00237ACECE|nr:hypothetical protein [Demequina sp. B12]MDE0571973.1 hypothetical protein [Demequina sp. B12]
MSDSTITPPDPTPDAPAPADNAAPASALPPPATPSLTTGLRVGGYLGMFGLGALASYLMHDTALSWPLAICVAIAAGIDLLIMNRTTPNGSI